MVDKSILEPNWAYDIQTQRCAKPEKVQTIHYIQSIPLRQINSAPWYISNRALDNDLRIETISVTSKTHY